MRSGFKAQSRAKRSILFRRKRVMNAVSAFTDIKNSWNIQLIKPPDRTLNFLNKQNKYMQYYFCLQGLVQILI
jgi:hypothetical protein